MRKLLAMGACVLIAASSMGGCRRNAPEPVTGTSAVNSPANLVGNGGFEGSEFSPWTHGVHAGPEVFLFEHDSAIRREGAQSMRITSVDGGPWGVINQDIGIPESPAGSQLQLTFQMRGAGTSRPGRAYVQFNGAGGNRREVLALQHPAQDYDWHPVEWKLPLPEKATSLTLGIAHYGAGTLWIDDVQLRVLPE